MAKIGYSTTIVNLRNEVQDVVNKYLSSGLDPATIKLTIDFFSALLDKVVSERLDAEQKLSDEEEKQENGDVE